MAKRRRYIGGGFCQDDFKSNQARRKPSKSLLIVTEGRNTEPAYFRALKEAWNVHPKVLSIETGGEGIPANLVDRANHEVATLEKKARRRELANNELGRFDEIWIVFDTEHAGRQGRLHDGIKAAAERGYHIAASTPCFEFWLALHFSPNAPPMDTCEEAARHLESAARTGRCTYSKEAGPTRDFARSTMNRVPDAVANATNLSRRQGKDPFPANPSTRVHELVRSIHATLPDTMKKRFPLE